MKDEGNDYFEIERLGGKQSLSGTIPVFGSKNEALIAFPAALVFEGGIVLENIPNLRDIGNQINLLRGVGATVTPSGNGSYQVLIPDRLSNRLDSTLVGKIRASVFLAVTLLARSGKAYLPYPGGDRLGPRPVDIFISSLRKMGAHCVQTNSHYGFTVPRGRLSGAEIFLRIQSVGATESLMLAGILARGKTVIKNAALEPEIVHLAEFLKSCGAEIHGVGTTTLTIEGTGPLSAGGKVYRMIPDRLETGTFLILGVLAGKKITITDCVPEHIEALLQILKEIASSSIVCDKGSITVENKKPLSLTAPPFDVRTHEYPGFASDLQPPLVVLLTQAEGKSLVFETIYEERFNYVGNLIHMGAKIAMYDQHRVSVRGKTPLSGAVHTSPDIRAGLAYILAALIAEGKSLIHNVYVIDRGYDSVEKRLAGIGASITRVKHK